ncbi:hypothetical protein CCHR01_17628 [Colletotrichum chrysophilum]|uniref:Uncharacterized protein n=1 Tax=Colletotrichum chrysophilum TaxID=1836956 RepID=A0AAD9E6Q0_9PEZI|nr:hypothetical protein CCHR01_17628 [Colletotrichum chrysophilum]
MYKKSLEARPITMHTPQTPTALSPAGERCLASPHRPRQDQAPSAGSLRTPGAPPPACRQGTNASGPSVARAERVPP